ncbi:aldose 1-epimerase family protein [Aliarcobacter butzleri]|uniref:Aldose 1-epimerase family protein n=1 Tax=Aliarcobacter butzleri TaxID=28197 RepID=A0AAW6VND5_9BACT|nr:aldose 1-epimerase family protein [Aliarcobacter butzleri]MDK2062067.1 aldose 1-epimerase family protein [Aliarcobacter butzleri]MDK2071033.1 aldose 1-epimerase family protein [Aliarcobacter butzleri]
MNYEIKNSFIKAQIKSFGAELNSLKKCDENFEYIWQANSKYWARHSPVLFPIVGRLKEDSYFYKNKKYSLSQHGFARDKEFEIVQNEADFIEFRLKSDEKSLEFYPFFFELNIGYKLDKNSLIVSYKVKNKSDEKMYFSIGAHPAFNTQVGDFLEFENIKTTKRYFLDEKGLIYKNEDLNLENSKLYLDKDLFKDDALVFNDSNIKQITLKNIENKSKVKVKFDNFPYLGIWSKPNLAPFVCIEPWFGVADEENANQKIEDKKGILSLEKEEEFFCFYTIEV